MLAADVLESGYAITFFCRPRRFGKTLNTGFDERYGFADEEVQALAAYLGYPDCMPEAREWYDGYRFGRADVYGLLEPGGVVWRPLDLGTELSRIARDSASFHNPVDEGACHMLLMGLCFGVPGYLDPISNRESGYGRNDFQLAPAPLATGLGTARPRPLVTVEVKFLRPDERA